MIRILHNHKVCVILITLSHKNELIMETDPLDNIINAEQLNGQNLGMMLNMIRIFADGANGYDELFKIIQAVSLFFLFYLLHYDQVPFHCIVNVNLMQMQCNNQFNFLILNLPSLLRIKKFPFISNVSFSVDSIL